MIKQIPHFNIAPDAKFGTRLRDHVAFQPPAPTRWERARTALAYASVIVGVGVAAFLVTPAHASGAFGIEVRVIHVSPSVSTYGTVRDMQKRQDFVARESVKTQNRMALERQKSADARALAADKAYYEKLKDQRKRSK